MLPTSIDFHTPGLRTTAASRAAQNFTMPALSPTMTEGNIASWKVKEGDEFVAGDVLLEIETDKASMDVEAQDDGIMMKIFQGDGSKSVQVGTRIGVLAEPGDDISSLELPADESTKSSAQPPKDDAAAKKDATSGQPSEAAPQKKAADPSQRKKSSGGKAPPQKYPLYPSVEHLVKEHKLDEAAISEITPTGPQGRLLKGDVLAYLGMATESRPADIKKRFDHNSHLDLSNIKIAAPAAPAKPAKAAAAKAPVPEDLVIAVPISMEAVIETQQKIEATLGTFLPLSTFVSRAAELANDELPLPANYKPSADELFNQVLGLNKVSVKASRGFYIPQIAALPTPSFTGVAPKPKAAAKVDIIDILAPKPKRSAKPAVSLGQPGISTGANTFSLKVPKTEEQRANAFLARMKLVLEKDPGRLVL
ncbi:pyridoxine biosynthesis protein [Pestalotiopsis sp. 9143b]|nr:pyridoxine biosynthesis protein [Pestalotiopsis sp. 9143b]